MAPPPSPRVGRARASHPVRQGGGAAAGPGHAVAGDWLPAWPRPPVQRAARSAGLRAGRDGDRPAAAAIARWARAPARWPPLAPLVAPGGGPLWRSAGDTHALTAIL